MNIYAVIPQDLSVTASPTFVAVYAGTLTIAAGSITDSSGAISFGNENLTTTGTVQGEQITSTDDITMAGYFSNTMAAADQKAIFVDGDTNPYTAQPSENYVNYFGRTYTGTYNPPAGLHALFASTMTWDATVVSTGGSGAIYGFYPSVVWSADMTQDGAWPIHDYDAIAFRGSCSLTSDWDATDAGTFGGSGTMDIVGMNFLTTNEATYNITAPVTVTANFYGAKLSAAVSGATFTAGSPNLNYYGGHFTATGSADGTSTTYGGYFTASGGDTNYGIYVAAGTSYFADHLQIAGGKNVVLSASTGTKIGTATSQLLGFYNATPVDQPATVSDATTQDLTGTDSIDQTKLESDLSGIVAAINAIIDRLQELGLIA